ncbi:LEPRE1 [Bugula neritina]|uniref:procollagen-proline 3-dioxygenase n=1 Tax=Bugula neritina TaxID=10212 RepID=A0A7J7JKW4_BUGNE|nr:LEPRE1 [Bugula neritina]
MEEVIKCKYGCTSTLSRLDLKIVDNILLNIYHHLQYSYSQVGDYKSGAEYAAAFLLHDPLNANMLTNKKYLMQEKNVPEKWFQPPQREVEHMQRLDTLAELMQYLHTEYVSQHSLGKKRQKQLAELEGFLGGNIKVNATAADLGGTERFVADGFATPEQCSHLINMCQKVGVAGYTRGVGDPPVHFSEREAIFSLGINQSQHLVEEGKLASPLLSMYLELSENTRRYTQMYFNLHELYFDFTHLVCRTALDERSSRDDLSHPVHADNCAIQKDGTCHKTSSSYTHRAYSGLLYLNDNFEGGEFFFTDNHKHEQSSVKPKCGRLVAFNAGDYHGVKAVRSGRRCALAVWFTLDPHHSEQSRADARDMLDKLHNHNLVHDEL